MLPKKVIQISYPSVAAALWGGLYVIVDMETASYPPITLSFSRLVIGVIVLSMIVKITKPRRDYDLEDHYRFIWLGILSSVVVSTQFIGTTLTNSAQASVLFLLSSVFVLPIAAIHLDEDITQSKLCGTGLSLIGVILMMYSRYGASKLISGNVLGVVMIVSGAAAWSGYTVYGKPIVQKYSAIEAVTLSLLYATPLTGVFSIVEIIVLDISTETLLSITAMIDSVLILGIFSTAAAYYLWYKGVKYVDTSYITIFLYLQPIVGVSLGVLILDITLSPVGIVGIIVTLIGVGFASNSLIPLFNSIYPGRSSSL
jgi:drug/metabolite transporter (DMT)-like permease